MTTFTVEHEANYAAEIIKVAGLIELPGLDNLVGLAWAGYTALVPRTTQVGDIMVIFPAEAQLSHEFASANNLYRHSGLNYLPEVVGYLEDNRRVRAIKFRGHRSSALALPLDSLAYFLNATVGMGPALVVQGEPGTQFDTVEGWEVSRKYELPAKGTGMAGKSQQEKMWRRVDTKFLPEHYDTEQYFRNSHKIPQDAYVTVTQKVHGTSIRLGNTIVKRKLSWFERLAQRLGVHVADTEYDYVFGSRKVIKDPHNPNQDHFYDYDLWGTEGAKYEHLIPKNVVLYGELIGWTKDGQPIQENYTYDVSKEEGARLYVYRVAVVSADGILYDLPWEGVKQFCAERGLNVVPEVWSGFHYDFDAEAWVDQIYYPDFNSAVPLSDPKSVDEGVVVRWDGGVTPTALKIKSPIFLGHETALLDKDVEVLS